MLRLDHMTHEAEYRRRLRNPAFCQRLVLFREGTLTLRHGGTLVALQGPSVLNHSPLDGLEFVGADWEDAWVVEFDGIALDQLVASAFLLLCPMTGVMHLRLSGQEFSTLETVMRLMDDPAVDSEILLLQTQLLIKYLSGYQTDSNSHRFAEHELVKQYVTRVDQDHRTVHEVSQYASALGVSTRTLNRVFKDSTGITPKASLTYRINLAAKSRLRQGHESVKEISYALGFSSTTYFHEFFRKSNGLTPGEYARQTG